MLLSAKRAAYFCKTIAIEMGGASPYFSKVRFFLFFFRPTFHEKSLKPIFGNFTEFPSYSRRLSIHFNRFPVSFNQFQSVSIQSISVSFNQFLAWSKTQDSLTRGRWGKQHGTKVSGSGVDVILLTSLGGAKPPLRNVPSSMLRRVPTTPDPNTSEKVSRYKWEAYRDTNWWCIYYFLPRGGHTFAKVCHRNGRGIAILFKSIGVRGCFDSPESYGCIHGTSH